MATTNIKRVLNLIDLLGRTFIFGMLTFQLDIVMASFIYAAFFLGPWQMISSLITAIANSRFLRLRLIHLISSSIYLGGWAVVDRYSIAGYLTIGVAFCTPAILAAVYYRVTLMTFLSLGTYPRLKHFFVDNFHNFLKIRNK